MTDRLRLFAIVLSAAASMAVWLIAYAVILRLVYGDGKVLALMVYSRPFAPLEQFWAYRSNTIVQKVALMSLAPALLVSGVVIASLLKRDSHPLGNASFQDMASLRRGKWFRKDGHILGRVGQKLLRVNDERHHMVIGPTRSGKGVSYVIPNALIHQGSMIVTDLKGEIYEATAGHRRRRGDQVFLFAPGQKETNCYNPLDFIRSDRGDRTTDVQNIADMLIPETAGSDNAIWQATAQQLLAGLISYVTESRLYENRRNLGEVNSFLNKDGDLQARLSDVKENEPSLSKFTIESFNAYIALSERAAQSALLDLQKAMRPFKNERIVAATTVTDINIRAMTTRPISIYLAPTVTDLSLLRPLIALFVQQTMSLLTHELDPKRLQVFFLLDEFCQLKRMDEIVSKVPYVAGYNIKLAFIIQDLKSLDAVYGETLRHSLLANCGYQLIFGANDLATADYVSRSLGKRTIGFQTQSRSIELFGRSRRSKTDQIRERDLMMPQEIRELPPTRLIILCEGNAPILARKLQHHRFNPGLERKSSSAR